MESRIEKQMDFLREIDKLKQIGRQSYLTDGGRKENDAEHSWHLAMCALVLREYMPEPVDVARRYGRGMPMRMTPRPRQPSARKRQRRRRSCSAYCRKIRKDI